MIDDALLRNAVRGAVALAGEAARYFAHTAPFETDKLGTEHGLRLASESFRVTSRITHAVSWLLTQLAVTAGELTAAQARSTDRRLGGHRVCLSAPDAALTVPPGLAHLLTESERLFRRVARLDAALDRPPLPPRRGGRPRPVGYQAA